MVAYSFQKRFVAPIRAGTKTQTIRAFSAAGKRHVLPGRLIQLYTGMRTKACERIIADVVCVDVLPIHITMWDAYIDRITIGNVPRDVVDLDAFARADGFRNLDDMSAFFREMHRDGFKGALIKWQPTTEGVGK